jgi:hypothetical protein
MSCRVPIGSTVSPPGAPDATGAASQARVDPYLSVYGVYIEPKCKAQKRERMRAFIGDQADPAFWQRVLSDLPSVIGRSLALSAP